MTKQAQNIEIYAGDTANINVTVFDSDSNGARKNIAGSVISWVLFDPDATGVMLTKTTADAISITDGLNGEFVIPLVPADTETIPPGSYRHEAEVTDTSGNVSTAMTGDFIIKESRA
jgi:hypothetical protein